MPFYTSHIYLEAKPELLSFLKSDSVLSNGLYHLRQSTTYDIHPDYQNKFPENGLVVVREVCDPNKAGNDHDEAMVHGKLKEPIVSWWELKATQDIKVIFPLEIPTLAFGRIIINDEHNPPPPVEFLRFLKNLSLIYNITVAFYHKYSAYEDELAMAEYAWIFGKQDKAYVRHIDGIYNITQYMLDAEPKVMINSKRESYSQPILHLVLKEFDTTIKRFDDRRPYFYGFKWNDYGI